MTGFFRRSVLNDMENGLKGYIARLYGTHMRQVCAMEMYHLDNPELCMRSSYLDIVKSISNGCSFGYFEDGKLLAYSLAYPTEYGTAYIDKCFVSPERRGYGLQLLMLKKNIEALTSKGIKEVFTMVAPANTYSIHNFMECGFKFRRHASIEYERDIYRYEVEDIPTEAE
jgi:ribosomal protein S18 acetylase RimI-like enzyme